VEHTIKVELPEDFMSDLPDLDGSTVKCYLVLKELADIARSQNQLEPNGMARVYCGYDYVKNVAGVSKPMFRKAMIALTVKGWICGFERGHNGGSGKLRRRTSNEYLIPFQRTYSQEDYNKMITWKKEHTLPEDIIK